MFDEKSEWEGWIILVVNKFLMCDLILLIIVGGICWYFCLNGCLLDNLILCFILFVVLIFVLFVENIFW